MKKILILIVFFVSGSLAKAQTARDIFVNLYTDSLKKGTYNYINIDGLLSNGNYVPLDSSSITFSASDGKFYGNSLLIDKDFKKDKVEIKVCLKNNPAIAKEFTMFIKKNSDGEKLKTAEEIIEDIKKDPGKRNKKKT